MVVRCNQKFRLIFSYNDAGTAGRQLRLFLHFSKDGEAVLLIPHHIRDRHNRRHRVFRDFRYCLRACSRAAVSGRSRFFFVLRKGRRTCRLRSRARLIRFVFVFSQHGVNITFLRKIIHAHHHSACYHSEKQCGKYKTNHSFHLCFPLSLRTPATLSCPEKIGSRFFLPIL